MCACVLQLSTSEMHLTEQLSLHREIDVVWACILVGYKSFVNISRGKFTQPNLQKTVLFTPSPDPRPISQPCAIIEQNYLALLPRNFLLPINTDLGKLLEVHYRLQFLHEVSLVRTYNMYPSV